jgi:hypothetical protein
MINGINGVRSITRRIDIAEAIPKSPVMKAVL